MKAVRKRLHFEASLELEMLDAAQNNLEAALKFLEESSREYEEEKLESIQKKVHKLARTVNKITRFLLEKRVKMEEGNFFNTD